MRAAAILLWIVLAVILARLLLRRLAVRLRRPGRGIADELVKDPVCHTYVARSLAVRGESGGAPVYFCSEACARRHAASG